MVQVLIYHYQHLPGHPLLIRELSCCPGRGGHLFVGGPKFFGVVWGGGPKGGAKICSRGQRGGQDFIQRGGAIFFFFAPPAQLTTSYNMKNFRASGTTFPNIFAYASLNFTHFTRFTITSVSVCHLTLTPPIVWVLVLPKWLPEPPHSF